MARAAEPVGAESSAELYPIRTVASLTGVNPITLRAWERRYGLIRPARTDGGHRLYSRGQIEQIQRALTLLEKGIPISQVSQLIEGGSEPAERAIPAGPWHAFVERFVTAIGRFDEDAVEDTFNDVLALYPSDVVTDNVLLPLLEELGERWSTAEGSVAEEHFFSVFLRNKLGARFHHRARANAGPKLLIACLPGEQHEIGALLFALAAHDVGYRVVLLGANAPLGELPTVVRRAAIDAVVLSGSVAPAPELLTRELPQLVAAAGVPVFVGGLTSVSHRDELVAALAQPLGADLRHGMRRLRELLPT